MKTLKIITSFIFLTVLIQCKTPEKISGYYNYSVECLGIEFDGDQILKTWGTGLNRNDIKKDAYKKAISDVLFKGIISTKGCNTKPLIIEANAKEKYSLYFRDFFSDSGSYQSFITQYNNSKITKNKKSNSKEAYAFYILLDIDGLTHLLKEDDIIN